MTGLMNCTCGKKPMTHGTEFLGAMVACPSCNKRTKYYPEGFKKAMDVWNRRMRRERKI